LSKVKEDTSLVKKEHRLIYCSPVFDEFIGSQLNMI